MTKLTQLLQKSGGARNPQKNFKFSNSKLNYKNQKIGLAPALKPKVLETRSKLGSGLSCNLEMAVMLDCLKAHNFNETQCAKEIVAFNKCVEQAKVTLEKRQQAHTDQLGVKGQLNPKQVNRLLRMYPQQNVATTLTHFAGKPMDRPVKPEAALLRRQTNDED